VHNVGNHIDVGTNTQMAGSSVIVYACASNDQLRCGLCKSLDGLRDRRLGHTEALEANVAKRKEVLGWEEPILEPSS